MTDTELLEALVKAASHIPDEPWHTVDSIWLPPEVPTYVISGHHDPHVGKPVVDAFMPDDLPDGVDEEEAISEADAIMDFCAKARNAIPALSRLLAEHKRLGEQNEKARQFLCEQENFPFRGHKLNCNALQHAVGKCDCGLDALRRELSEGG